MVGYYLQEKKPRKNKNREELGVYIIMVKWTNKQYVLQKCGKNATFLISVAHLQSIYYGGVDLGSVLDAD